MKWIIIDLKTKDALYGVDRKTLMFSTKEIAEEVATQFFKDLKECFIISITLIKRYGKERIN